MNDELRTNRNPCPKQCRQEAKERYDYQRSSLMQWWPLEGRTKTGSWKQADAVGIITERAMVCQLEL